MPDWSFFLFLVEAIKKSTGKKGGLQLNIKPNAMKNILLILSILFAAHVFSQDLIILRNGDEIKAKVTEINESDISYKRESNPTGPTYKLQKSKIFFIRYASGDKDFFGTADPVQRKATPSPTTSAPKEFVFDPNIGIEGCQIKKQKGTRVYGDRGNEIYYRNDIVYYGFDFTYLMLTNPGKVGKDVEIIQKYFFPMHEDLTKDFLPLASLKKWMKQPSIVMGNSVFPNYKYRDFHHFVSAQNFCIRFDDLQRIVQSYVLREKKGVGMVINLVNFNKEREYALVYVTFFDIETREILFAVEASGASGGGGMTKHWAVGVEEAVRGMFIDQVYKHRWTSNNLIPGKLLFY